MVPDESVVGASTASARWSCPCRGKVSAEGRRLLKCPSNGIHTAGAACNNGKSMRLSHNRKLSTTWRKEHACSPLIVPASAGRCAGASRVSAQDVVDLLPQLMGGDLKVMQDSLSFQILSFAGHWDIPIWCLPGGSHPDRWRSWTSRTNQLQKIAKWSILH